MAAALFHAWVILGVLLAGPGGVFEGYREEPMATGKLLSKGWSEAEGARIAKLLPGILADVEGRLERKLGHPFTTVLAPDLAEVRRIVEAVSGRRLGSNVLGVALPGASLLVIRGGYALFLDGSRSTLAHEVAHLVIHAGAEDAIPRWLDEGVAMWASGESLGADAESYLALLARVDGLYSLRSLTYQFPEDHLPGSVAYQQSFLFICFLVERLGADAVPRLLSLYSMPAGVGSRLSVLLGKPEKEVEAEFRGWVLGRRPLLSALGAIVNVWTVSSVLALAAIARYVVRRRRRIRALEEEALEEEALEDESRPYPEATDSGQGTTSGAGQSGSVEP